jgi:hypothetical protein
MSGDKISLSPSITCPCSGLRPGAFDYALPLKKWKSDFTPCYQEMLVKLREKWPEEGRGVKEFLGILELHQRYPAKVVEMAVRQALTYGCVHVDGVLLCIYQMIGREGGSVNKGEKEKEGIKEREGQPIDLTRLVRYCSRVVGRGGER